MASSLSEDTMDISDAEKNKVESFDIDGAIKELNNILDDSAEMYHQLKKVKFEYLVQSCELYSRIDFPNIMIEACRRGITKKVPTAKMIEKSEF